MFQAIGNYDVLLDVASQHHLRICCDTINAFGHSPVPLGATLHATRTAKGHFCTSFLVKFIRQTIRDSSLQQSARRRRSAHEQSRQSLHPR